MDRIEADGLIERWKNESGEPGPIIGAYEVLGNLLTQLCEGGLPVAVSYAEEASARCLVIAGDHAVLVWHVADPNHVVVDLLPLRDGVLAVSLDATYSKGPSVNVVREERVWNFEWENHEAPVKVRHVITNGWDATDEAAAAAARDTAERLATAAGWPLPRAI